MAAPPKGSGGIYEVVVDRPVAISMVFIAAVVFGVVSYTRLPLNLFPDLTYPTLTVRTEYPGAAPEEVETQVCRPLEEELSTIPGLVEISSISRAELGDVILEFDWDTNMDEVSQMARERMSRMMLPAETQRPILLRYDPSLDPILRIGITGGDNEYLLRHLSENIVKRKLEVLSGVAAVKVRGGLEREIAIELDEGLLAKRGLTIEGVAGRLAAENLNLAGGSIKEGDTEYLIRTLNEFRSVEEIREVLIPCPDGTPTRLGDLGTVTASHREREVVGHIDGTSSVEIRVYREADANVVRVARSVKAALFGAPGVQRQIAMIENAIEKEQARREGGGGLLGRLAGDDDSAAEGERSDAPAAAETETEAETESEAGEKKPGLSFGPGGGEGGPDKLEQLETALADLEEMQRKAGVVRYHVPEGVELHLVGDQSAFIEDSLRDVRGAALIGGLLAVLIIFLFLRDVWSTLIISVAIPLSVVMTFTPMFLSGVSLNLMSLGGLALGIGMLVDSSIVVLESIYRCREEGDEPRAAAVRGAREVAAAVAASTFTTVAVFFPIVFVKGVAGQLFGNLALTVVFSLLASLCVALFLIPMLAARRLGTGSRAVVRFGRFQAFGPVQAWQQLRHGLGSVTDFVRRGSGIGKVLRALLSPAAYVYVVLRGVVMLPLSTLTFVGGAIVAVFGKIVVGVGRAVFGGGGKLLGPLLRLFDRAQAGLTAAYTRLLDGALGHRSTVLVIAVLLLLGSVLLAARLGQELIPTVHQGEFDVELSNPVGTPLEETLGTLALVEERIADTPGVAQVMATAGTERTADAELGKGEHTIDLHVRVEGSGRLDRVEQAVQDELRRELGSIPDLEVQVREPTLFSFRAPVEIAVFGHDLTLLRRQVYAVVDEIDDLAQLTDVRTDLRRGFPELRIRYDREQLAARGLDIFTVARAVRDKVEGNVATDLRGRDDRIDVRVRLRPSQVDRVEDIERLNVNPAGNPPIWLTSVAQLEMAEGPSEIRHVDQRRAGLVTAGLAGFDLGGATRSIEQRLERMAWPPEFTYEIRGQSREMEVSLRSLRFALGLAVFLVYVIMAATFESFRHPFVILFSIPLAIVGVIPVLALLRISMSVLVLIGAIVLAGIVVNNAIVLVDYVNQLRRRGLALAEALRTAGQARLRPILITTMTTVLGLLPMAVGVGRGFEIRQSLAVTVIAGLLASTLLTLVVVPVVYHLLAGRDPSPDPTDAAPDATPDTQAAEPADAG